MFDGTAIARKLWVMCVTVLWIGKNSGRHPKFDIFVKK